ncbi:AAA family ATPase [Methanimicrococcus blatticola]|uniref:MoxR-like ATPase n=1 Tax=Methanimicrococcus blatticola TaxID=91560 RepID=A0A484F6Q3_9EURY|nr:MoxR family ATPase [Methanimicrococcus blatticola]MBZ3935053.1 MoxR family ATPase [Methanimicrococcus blatticola]MCC2508850.1 MoxR family ATPase [Methanimicrococcus blatticola]TDQ71123.1 MoxR-like ATPase [Methanimicrococcus blatticola]
MEPETNETSYRYSKNNLNDTDSKKEFAESAETAETAADSESYAPDANVSDSPAAEPAVYSAPESVADPALLKTYENAHKIFTTLFDEIGKVIVGQQEVVEQVMIALLCNGHALLESNPGLGKTLTISTISKVVDLSFNRIQCTPDLMPADITGTTIVEEHGGDKKFRFEHGPVFANIVLADEINRASPKTQSALLEAMQEKQVTVAGHTYPLDKPFFVLATQNPIEQEGTYPLPEAQLDRFLLKILVPYPDYKEELEIVNRYTAQSSPATSRGISKDTLVSLQKLTKDVPIAEDLKTRTIQLVIKTRDGGAIEYGASPRASIAIILAAKARALIHGRNYVAEEDVIAISYPVLRHRIILSFEAERSGVTPDDAIEDLLIDAGFLKPKPQENESSGLRAKLPFGAKK